jgi:hypothetical protein
LRWFADWSGILREPQCATYEINPTLDLKFAIEAEKSAITPKGGIGSRLKLAHCSALP